MKVSLVGDFVGEERYPIVVFVARKDLHRRFAFAFAVFKDAMVMIKLE